MCDPLEFLRRHTEEPNPKVNLIAEGDHKWNNLDSTTGIATETAKFA